MMRDTIKNLTIKNSTSGPLWIFQKGSQPIVSYFSFVIEIQIQTIENSVRLLFKAFLNNTFEAIVQYPSQFTLLEDGHAGVHPGPQSAESDSV